MYANTIIDIIFSYTPEHARPLAWELGLIFASSCLGPVWAHPFVRSHIGNVNPDYDYVNQLTTLLVNRLLFHRSTHCQRLDLHQHPPAQSDSKQLEPSSFFCSPVQLILSAVQPLLLVDVCTWRLLQALHCTHCCHIYKYLSLWCRKRICHRPCSG